MTFIEGKWYLNYVVAKSTAVGLTAQGTRARMRRSSYTAFFMRNPSSFIRAGWVVDTERYAGSLVPVLSAITQFGPFLCALTGARPIKTGEYYV